jgi:ADP-ribose pyrophosphatase YjhB (NUDIX family)
MAHIHDKIDFTVDVFIVHEDRVLLRLHDKYNKWLAVGGHIELDEDPVQAAYREVEEEVGLAVKLVASGPSITSEAGYTELVAPSFLNRHRINETHEHISFVYFAQALTTEIKPAADELVCECRWFASGELSLPEYNISSDIQRYAQAALDSVLAT